MLNSLDSFFKINRKFLDLTSEQERAIQEFNSLLYAGHLRFISNNCLCGNTIFNSLLITKKDRYGVECPQYLCKKCGTIFSSMILDSDSMSIFYTTLYRRMYVGHARPPESFFSDQTQRGLRLYNYCKSFLNKEMNVLEIGCGAGGVLKVFHDQGLKSYGCDFDENYLEYGKSKGLNLQKGSFKQLESKSYDLIILSHVLEHIAIPADFIREIKSILKPNGYLLIEVPGLLAIHRSYTNFHKYFQMAHTFSFHKDALISTAESVGFKTIQCNEDVVGLFQNSTNQTVQAFRNKFVRVFLYISLLHVVEVLSIRNLISRVYKFFK